MTPRHYHTPPPPISTRVRCPVCHQAVFSRGDIHPQCAVQRAEAPKPKGRPQGAPVAAEEAVQAPEQAGDDDAVDPPTTGGISASDRPSA